jgi:putative ABC transport system substrate-binding protein
MIGRRGFVTLLGGAAAAWPRVGHAQQPGLPVIGYLSAGGADPSGKSVAAFLKGLAETGFIEGRDITIDYRFAENELDRLPGLAADLVRRHVAVIVTPIGFSGALAAKAATTTIPIVFSSGAFDPVEYGLVASLNRPGGNMTGITSMNTDLGPRRLGLVHELLPKADRFAVMFNRNQPAARLIPADMQGAASAIGGQIEVLAVTSSRDIDAAFATLVQKRVEALMVSANSLFYDRRVQLVTLASRHAVPTIYTTREDAEAGGLMSYGSSRTEQQRQIGMYAGRILKGEKPADLPVQRASKFEFIINLQTAKTLGIDIPPTLLAIADEVIE